MSGIMARLAFESPTDCPVGTASEGASEPLTEVSWTQSVAGTVTEQFTTEEDLESFETVFDYGRRRVYGFERDADSPCVCERVQEDVGPVREVRAVDGTLRVTVHTADVSGLRTAIADLQEEFGGVNVECLVRTVEGDEGDLVPVDLRRLTDRQREVLETAHGMGYFEYPREANARQVAAELGIEQSTFAEHLATAQRKLLAELLEAPTDAEED